MPLGRFLAKLLESHVAKEAEACKAAIKDELANLSKTQRDSRELHAAVQQIFDLYLAKKAEFIVDIAANFQEAVASELLRQVSDKILVSHKEFATFSSTTGANYSASQANRSYEILCCSLEFLLKVTSRGPWWNQLVLSTTWTAFSEIIRDRTLGCECYISVVYILSICVPYSIASLDERLMLWLCSIANTLLNRTFSSEGGGSKAAGGQQPALSPQVAAPVAQQHLGGGIIGEENTRAAIMQLVLILYGIIPITFIRQLMQNCPSDVVDFVVSQLRLHPILSQHLAQRVTQAAVAQQAVAMATTEIAGAPANNTPSSPVIGGGGLSQAECKSKNRFRGKDFSDIVTECLNYEATSPPKMFSADFPPTSLLGSNNQTAMTNSTSSITSNDQQQQQHEAIVEAEEDEKEKVKEDQQTLLGGVEVANGGKDLLERGGNNAASQHEHHDKTRWSAVEFDTKKTAASKGLGNEHPAKWCQHHPPHPHLVPDWYHTGTTTGKAAYFYSCPASPTLPAVNNVATNEEKQASSNNNVKMVKKLQTQPPFRPVRACGLIEIGEPLQRSSETLGGSNSTSTTVTPSKSTAIRSRAGTGVMRAQRSLAQVNEAIRARLAEHRTASRNCNTTTTEQGQPPMSPMSATSSLPPLPLETSIPGQYAKSYVKLAQLQQQQHGWPDSTSNSDVKEQLRLSQLSLSYLRHRELIFICKNRSLMSEHKKNGELEGHLEEARRRIHDLEAKLEHESERRQTAEQRVIHLLTQPQLTAVTTVTTTQQTGATGSQLSVNTIHPPGSDNFLLSELSPRYRKAPPVSIAPGGSSFPVVSKEKEKDLQSPIFEQVSSGEGQQQVTTGGDSKSSGGGMHRAQSSSEFSSSSTANVTPMAEATVTKRDWDDLVRNREDLQAELGVLRQHLRQAQLEACADNNNHQDCGGAGVGEEAANRSKVSSDETADRIELLTQQLNDSRREVATLNEMMAEMKTRLDVAEIDRRRLSAELTRIALYGPGATSKFILSLATGTTATGTAHAPSQSSQQSASASTSTSNNQQQNQYPTLKKQVEKILLKKQEIATTSSTTS